MLTASARLYTVDHTEFEKMIGWVHVDSNFPMLATAAASASAAVDCLPEALLAGTAPGAAEEGGDGLGS
eukprot:940280-Lingulodinium_polyedra.AAC.1